MTPEAKVKVKVRKILDAADVYWYQPNAGMYGTSGIADFVGVVDSVPFQIETKAGKGKMTALQRKNAMHFQNHGGVFFLIDGTEVELLRLEVFLENPHLLSARPPLILPLVDE